MQTDLEKLDHQIEIRERLEHQDALLAIGAIIDTKHGRALFRYLFKNLEVGTLPERFLEGNILHEKLGFLRAGNSIYQLACQAASDTTAQITASIEREKYEDLIQRYNIEHQLNANSRNRDTD